MTTIDVKAYGAKGDGVTNDAASIQAACDAAFAAGGSVYVPKGKYQLGTQSLILRGAVTLYGDGFGTRKASQYGSTFLYSGGAAALQLNDGSDTPTVCDIRGVRVDCQGQGAYCIQIGTSAGTDRSAQGLLSHIRVTGATVAAVRSVQAVCMTLLDVKAIDNPGTGFLLDDQPNSANSMLNMISCWAQNCGRGIHIRDAGIVSLLSCAFETSAAEGVLIEALSDNLFSIAFRSCLFERNGGANLRAEAPSVWRVEGLTIEDSRFSSPGNGVQHSFTGNVITAVFRNSYENPNTP